MEDSKKLRVAVIGGGAGGLAAALTAAQAGAICVIYEQANRVGKKLLKTGNGRCNLTNETITPAAYNHPDFVAPVLSKTGTSALLDFFAALGLWTVSDSEGRVYPRSDTAASVLDVLRLGCARAGVAEQCGREVAALLPESGRWRLRFRAGEDALADAVIVVTGGGSSLLRPLGHALVPFSPVLCPLRTRTEAIRSLSGLRVRCRVRLLRGERELAAEEGEVLFRDYGVSGIVILNMSRLLEPECVLSLDLLPELGEAELAARLRGRPLPREELLTGIFHRRVGEALRRAAVSGAPEALARAIKDFRLPVLGPADAASAQVTRGGACLDEFDPVTLQSRLHRGLYAAGEALDIDGRCGGYNLHWAFASGREAGRSAAHG